MCNPEWFVVTLVTKTGREKNHPLVLYIQWEKGWRGSCSSSWPNLQEKNSDWLLQLKRENEKVLFVKSWTCPLSSDSLLPWTSMSPHFWKDIFSKSNHSSAKIVTVTTALVHFQIHTFSYPHLVLGANMFCHKYFFILADDRQLLKRNTATEDEVAQKRLFLVRVIQILKIPAKGKFTQTLKNSAFKIFKSLCFCVREFGCLKKFWCLLTWL